MIEYVSNEIANKFCSGCEIINAPPFLHICLLSKIDKFDEFNKEAYGISIKAGLLSKAFYNKAIKKVYLHLRKLIILLYRIEKIQNN